MSSKFMAAILWTLVSVNIITLVLGGLITWLGYAIPIRLKQFGLLPGLVIIAGSASLVVACVGLCALNYSSHHAMNIYGFSCALFVILLVFGLPESWYKSSQIPTAGGSLLMSVVYFALIAILTIVLMFAFVMAHYLRRKRDDQDEEPEDHLAARSSSRVAGLAGESPRCSCPFQLQLMPPITNQSAADGLANSSNMDKWLNWNSIGAAAGQSAGYWRQPTDCSLPRARLERQPDHRLAAAQSNNGLGQLVHRGFYRQTRPINQLVRAKSCSQPLSGPLLGDELGEQSEGEWRNEDTRASSSQGSPANSDLELAKDSESQQRRRRRKRADTGRGSPRSSSGDRCLSRSNHATHDDTAVQYHRHHRRRDQSGRNSQANRNNNQLDASYLLEQSLPKCSCHLGSSRSIQGQASRQQQQLIARLGVSPSGGLLPGRQLAGNQMMSYTLPRLPSSLVQQPLLESSQSYKPKKIRAKGSSSIMAMTAAAAAALLGGVADVSAAQTNDNDATGDLFTGTCEDLGADFGDRCNFDHNDHQLDASALVMDQNLVGSHPQETYSQHPVLDFTPLLDGRKSRG